MPGGRALLPGLAGRWQGLPPPVAVADVRAVSSAGAHGLPQPHSPRRRRVRGRGLRAGASWLCLPPVPRACGGPALQVSWGQGQGCSRVSGLDQHWRWLLPAAVRSRPPTGCAPAGKLWAAAEGRGPPEARCSDARPTGCCCQSCCWGSPTPTCTCLSVGCTHEASPPAPHARTEPGQVCSCHVCGLTLVSSPHLARSYHHLFPVPAFQEDSRRGPQVSLCLKAVLLWSPGAEPASSSSLPAASF